MTDHKHTRAQAQLQEERSEALIELDHLRQELQGNGDPKVDEADAQLLLQETDGALIAILERRIHAIDTALAAIARGTYGTCERCGKPIEEERLRAKPDAPLCLTCQKKSES